MKQRKELPDGLAFAAAQQYVYINVPHYNNPWLQSEGCVSPPLAAFFFTTGCE